MSSIDNRIVQMQFENSQFEKGVKESLKSIEELEKSLEFKDAEKGLAALQKAGDSFSLAKMAEGIEKIEQRFSVMGIVGKRIIEDITDSAVRMGEQFVKSISTDQISEGWKKYAEKTEAVQTIIAATGKDIGYVEAQLEKLNWFTDETSYDFVDMTSNIGKFTSMGIDLETSVTAMQGIATWAAVSGQNAQTASRAMYNMSQAIGVGSVKLMDWKSIENANMATKEFKQTAIETAKALGKLNAQGKTAKGTAVTFENFSQTLSEGWFTKDVLLKALDKYGEYANKVYEIATEKGIPASEAMKLITDDTMALGEKAFKAAQEAKTFADAINSVKDAVSTGWMNIFQDLFGNYEEAKVLWTDLANYLWDMFAAPISNTHELLAEWNKLGGRKELLQGIYDIFEGIANIVTTVKEAIADVFPPATADNLLNISKAVAEFGENFKKTFSRTEQVDKVVFKRVKDAVDPIKQLLDQEDLAAGHVSENVKALQEDLVKLGLLDEKYANGIYNPATQTAIKKFNEGIDSTSELLDKSFKMGDKGKEVEDLQKKLKELGFDPGGIDGIWGKKTQKAFDAYRASLGKTEKAYKELRKGMRGEDVRQLQQKLIDADLLDEGQADGIFGPKTEEALKKYQKAQKIAESGIVDKDTFASLNPEEKKTEDGWEKEYVYVTKYSSTLENLKRIISGASAVIHIFTSFFGFLGKVIGHVWTLLSPLVDAFIAIGAAVGDSIVSFDKWLQETGVFNQWFENVKKFLEPFGKWVEEASKGLLSFFGLTDDASESADKMMTFPQLYENIKNAIKKTGIVEKVSKAWENFSGVFRRLFLLIRIKWRSFKKTLGEGLGNTFAKLPETIASVTEWLGNLASDGLDLISSFIQKIPGAIDKVKEFWATLTQKGDPESGKAPGFLTRVKDGFQSVIDFLFGEGDIANGKQPGLFRKIGQLLSGDLDGFTEGMDDETKQQVLDKIQGVKDFIQKVREAIIVLFGGELGDDKKISDETIKKINDFKNSIAAVFEGIALLFTGKVQKNSKLSGKARRTIRNIRKTIIGIAELIGKTLSDIYHTIVGIFTGEVTFESVGEFFASFWASVQQFFADASGVVTTNLGSAGEQISNFFSNLWGIVKTIGTWALIGIAVWKVGSLIGNISGAFYKLKEVIGSYKRNTQALSKSILEFAGAVALIAGSIWLVGQLDSDQFTRGAAAVGGIVVAIIVLLGACALLSTTLGKGVIKQFKQLGNAILEIGIGIGVIALAIALLGVLPQEVFEEGLLKLVGIMIIIGIFLWALSTVGGTNIKLKGFWQIAIVIAAMAYIAVKLGKVPIDQLTDGVIALGFIMGILAGFIWVMGKIGASKIKLKGFIGLAAAVAILAYTAAKLGKQDQGKLWSGIGAVAALMAMIAGIAYVMGKFGKDIKIGTMLLLFAGIVAVMLVFNYIIQQIKDVDPGILYAFSLSLAIALAAFVAACLIVGKLKDGPKSMLKGAGAIGGAIAIFAAVLTGIVYGLGKLDEVQPGVLKRGGEALKTIGEALKGFGDALGLSGEEFVLVLGAATMLGMLEGGQWTSTMKGALSIGGAIAIFAVVLTGIVYGLGKLDEVQPGVLEHGKNALKTIGEALNGFGDALHLSGDEVGLILLAATAIGMFDTQWLSTLKGAVSIGGAIDILIAIPAALVYGLGKLDEVQPGVLEHGKNALSTIASALTGFADALGLSGKEVMALIGAAGILGMLDGSFVSFVKGGAAIGGAIDALIAVLAIIVAALGGLDKLTNGAFNDILQRGSDAFNKVGSAIGGFIGGLKEGIFGKKVNEKDLGVEQVQSFGTAFEIFRGAISGLNEDSGFSEDITSATMSVDNLYTFFQEIAGKIPDGQGLMQFNSQITSLLTHVEEFGRSLGIFHTNIVGFDYPGLQEDTQAALTTTQAIVDFLKDLKSQSDLIEHNKSAFQAFFSGDTVQGTVFTSLSELGTKVGEAKKNLHGIGTGTYSRDLDSAIDALDKIAALLIKFNNGDLTQALANSRMSSITEWLSAIAEQIGYFSDELNTKGVDTTSIALMLNSIAKLSEILSGEGPNRLTTDNFLSGLNIDDITTRLNEFSEYLGLALPGVATDISKYTEDFTNAGIDLSKSLSEGLSGTDLSVYFGLFIANALVNLDEYKNSFWVLGGNFAVGLANGMAFNAYLAVNAAKDVADRMAEAVRQVFDSHSPSRVAAEIGGYFTEGLAMGTTDKVGEATNAAEKVANSMLTSASGTLATLSGLLSEDIDTTPVIAPVVDLTNARQSASLIGGLFGNQSFAVSPYGIPNPPYYQQATSAVLANDIESSRQPVYQNDTQIPVKDAVSSDVAGAITTLNDRMASFEQAISNMKVVTETGALIGQIDTAIDNRLGELAMLSERGL